MEVVTATKRERKREREKVRERESERERERERNGHHVLYSRLEALTPEIICSIVLENLVEI